METKNLNLKKILDNFKMAEQGDAEAQYLVGAAYSRGFGVKQDYSEAVKWWLKAAEQGHADAIKILKKFE